MILDHKKWLFSVQGERENGQEERDTKREEGKERRAERSLRGYQAGPVYIKLRTEEVNVYIFIRTMK